MDLINQIELEKNRIEDQEIGINIEKKQESFFETTLGKVINKAVDIGISAIVPDLIEDEVIDVKNAILKNGFEDGVQTAIDGAINLGKSVLGIATGKIEDLSQAQNAIKSGGILDNVSNLFDLALNKAKTEGILNNGLYQVIKKGKNTVINQIEKGITEEFGKQAQNVEKLGKYMNQWKDYYQEQDFDGMQREYEKIREKMKELVPLEKTILEARKIENLHELIKNNNQNFDLTEEQKKLAEILI